MLFLSFSDNLLQDNHIFFFKCWQFWDKTQNKLNFGLECSSPQGKHSTKCKITCEIKRERQMPCQLKGLRLKQDIYNLLDLIPQGSELYVLLFLHRIPDPYEHYHFLLSISFVSKCKSGDWQGERWYCSILWVSWVDECNGEIIFNVPTSERNLMRKSHMHCTYIVRWVYNRARIAVDEIDTSTW